MVGTKIWIFDKKMYYIFNIILFYLYGYKNIDIGIFLQSDGIFLIIYVSTMVLSRSIITPNGL